jgi:hypothetical protein
VFAVNELADPALEHALIGSPSTEPSIGSLAQMSCSALRLGLATSGDDGLDDSVRHLSNRRRAIDDEVGGLA